MGYWIPTTATLVFISTSGGVISGALFFVSVQGFIDYRGGTSAGRGEICIGAQEKRHQPPSRGLPSHPWEKGLVEEIKASLLYGSIGVNLFYLDFYFLIGV